MRLTKKKHEAFAMMPTILRAIRESAGITQAEIAHELHVSRQFVHQLETGDTTASREQLLRWIEIMRKRVNGIKTYQKIVRLVRQEMDK